jgi:hypothetical protein
MHLDAKQFFYNHDVDALTYKYGRIGGPTGLGCPGKYGAVTSGSSTTVTAATGTPFDPVLPGDLIVFYTPPDTKTLRKVATKVSGSEITVDTAIDLGTTGRMFDFLPVRIGANAGDGWHSVQAYSAITVWVSISLYAATGGIDVTIEALTPNLGNAPVTISTTNYTATGTASIDVSKVVGYLRVGLKAGSGFAGTDAVSVWMTGEVRKAGY